MARFVEGEDRSQVALLMPGCLEDFVAEENPVRVVDAFVSELDLQALGFDGLTPASTGRPSYHPSVLLKIYIYGYLNRIQSSRRLERECQRNLELMWLTGKLAPDFKTIADFRRDSGKGIHNACRRFVVLCRELKLFSQTMVAIDGSKFKAVNNRDRNFTEVKIDRFQEQVARSIQRYMDTLETADRTKSVGMQAKTERLQEKIKKLRKRMRELDSLKSQLKTEPDEQLSLTDPDARSMATSRLGSGIVGYNVQVAVDAKHHLIVAHNVTNDSSDRSQLSAMALAARDAMGKQKLQAHADRGYYSSRELKACDDAGIAAYVPKSMTSGAKADGRFDKSEFIYIARNDQYQCPAGQRAIYRYTREEAGLQIRRYWSSACPQCPIKERCTPSDYRRISRWEHAAVLDDVQRRLDRRPSAMAIRKRTVEHVFGTLKYWMGSAHFAMRRLPNVATEMSLHVLAYNLKRAISILGMTRTMKAMKLVGA